MRSVLLLILTRARQCIYVLEACTACQCENWELNPCLTYHKGHEFRSTARRWTHYVPLYCTEHLESSHKTKKKKKSLVKNKAIFFTSFLEQWEIDSAFNINSMSGTSSLDS